MPEEKQHGGARPGSGRLQTRYNLSKAAAQHLNHIAAIHGLTRTEMLERLIEQRYSTLIESPSEIAPANVAQSMENTMTDNELYADILATVIDNDRLSDDWDGDELEVEIDAECRERKLSAEQTSEAIEYAQAHATH